MRNQLYKWSFFFVIWFLNLPVNIFAQEVQRKDSIPPHEQLYKDAVNLIDSAYYKEAIASLKKAIRLKRKTIALKENGKKLKVFIHINIVD
jgi:hypothetical protein